MTITSRAPIGVRCVRSGTAANPVWAYSPAVASNGPVLICHGDPSIFGVNDYFAGAIAQYVGRSAGQIWGPMMWALHSTGHPTVTPWTGSSWGTGSGQAAIAAQIAALFPGTGRNIDVIGQSMGGLGALVGIEGLISRVRSVFLISPVVDVMAQYDSSGGFASEIQTAWGTSDRASTLTATASVDPARNTATFAPVADRIFVMAANNDSTVPVAATKTWATAVGVPADQQLWTATGDHGAPMWDPAYDDLTILRHIERCAAL